MHNGCWIDRRSDKSLRKKVKTGISNAKELNSQGELIKSLGKAAGRIKRKLKKY